MVCRARASGAKPVRRFSSTVSSGKISRPCGTSAMPRLARSKGASAVTSSPFQRMRPRDALFWPTMARMSEVLPTPLRPMTQAIFPVSAVSETERRAWAAP